MVQNLLIENLFAPTKAGEAAMAYFAQNGLPNRRNEDFHYTDISRALSLAVPNIEAPDETPAPKSNVEIRILETGLKITGNHNSLRIAEFEPEAHNDIFAQLIYGMARSGHKVEIADNANLSISIIRNGNSRAILDIEIGKNAKVVIIEIHQSGGLSTFSARLNLKENATLNFYSTLHGGGIDLSAIGAIQAKNSIFNAYFTSEGGQMVRRNFGAVLAGENATVNIGGVYFLGNSHFDFFSNIIHQVPNCKSQENVRGVVSDGAHAVFQGKILVARDAQKTLGNMEHRALMLADGGRVNAKPTLEIYADDVECSHANTIGAIDESALFYMQSRGITKARAKALLTEAFLAQVFEEIENEGQKAQMLSQVRNSLDGLIK